MPRVLETALAGEPVRLYADRALYWIGTGALIIADLHLGKEDVFRASGIAVPAGETQRDLQRLARLLTATQARSLLILGDFLHGPRTERAESLWAEFRDTHMNVHIGVIPGNHDRRLTAESLRLDVLSGELVAEPFLLRHSPPAADVPLYVICGHIHPMLRIPGVGRHPLFWMRPNCIVLPAFSGFTGGWNVRPSDAYGSAVCDEDEIVLFR
jgi:DNA ligase-associated metallophosphoesterase